jgi:hypothetical protein
MASLITGSQNDEMFNSESDSLTLATVEMQQRIALAYVY